MNIMNVRFGSKADSQRMVYRIFICVLSNGYMRVYKPDFMDLYIMNPYIMI